MDCGVIRGFSPDTLEDLDLNWCHPLSWTMEIPRFKSQSGIDINACESLIKEEIYMRREKRAPNQNSSKTYSSKFIFPSLIVLLLFTVSALIPIQGQLMDEG